jgi:hypothetical protein
MVRNLASLTFGGYYHKQPIIELGCTHPSPALTTNLRRRSMKLVKKFVVAVLFVSALAGSTYAGDLETPGFVPPPPRPDRMMSSTATTDEAAPYSIDTSDELLYETWVALLSLF